MAACQNTAGAPGGYPHDPRDPYTRALGDLEDALAEAHSAACAMELATEGLAALRGAHDAQTMALVWLSTGLRCRLDVARDRYRDALRGEGRGHA